MAIRYRAGKASPWEVYYNDPSTGKRRANSYATEEEATKANALILYRLEHERDSFGPPVKEEAPSPKPAPKKEAVTYNYVCTEYLKSRALSLKNLKIVLLWLKTSLEILGHKDIREITKEDIIEVKHALLECDIKPVTAKNRMRQIKTVFNWAVENDYLDAIPKWPKPISASYTQFQPPTQDELERIFLAADPIIQRVIVLGSQTGIRIGACELFQLTWDDVDFTGHTIRIHGSHKNKNAQWREVPLSVNAMRFLARWREEDMAVGAKFIIHNKGAQVSRIDRLWTQSLKRAGITRHIRPYDLRHMFATEAIAHGADIGTVAKMMGHANPTMILQHYQYVTDQQKRQAVNSLPCVQN